MALKEEKTLLLSIEYKLSWWGENVSRLTVDPDSQFQGRAMAYIPSWVFPFPEGSLSCTRLRKTILALALHR